jgi:hypothetical protein
MAQVEPMAEWQTSELIEMSTPFVIGPDDWGEMSPGVKSAICADIENLELPGSLTVIGVTYQDGRIDTVTIDPNEPVAE